MCDESGFLNFSVFEIVGIGGERVSLVTGHQGKGVQGIRGIRGTRVRYSDW